MKCWPVVLLCSAVACSADGQRSDMISLGSVTRCEDPEPPAKLAPLDSDPHSSAFFTTHPLPLLQKGSGPVLRNPRIVTVFFGDDPLQHDTETLLQSFGCTSAWHEAVAEYGVGDAIYERSLVLPEFPDTGSTDDFEAWMRQEAKTLELNGAQRVFMFFAPAGERLHLPGLCTEEQGYHTSMLLDSNGDPIVYAVIAQCPPQGWVTARDTRLHITSHELMEMAVDPYPETDPAWQGIDQSRITLEVATEIGGVENADLCNSVHVMPPDYPFPVAGAWSNRRAMAGLNPCTLDERPFAVAYPEQTSLDLASGTAELDIDYYAEDPNAQFVTAIAVAETACTRVMGLAPKQPVADGTRLQIGLQILPACKIPPRAGARPHLEIDLETADGDPLQSLVVALANAR